MHESILEMLRTPGKYAVSTPSMAREHRYMMVEVDQDLVAHQLTTTGKRDSALHPDSWSPLAQVVQLKDKLEA